MSQPPSEPAPLLPLTLQIPGTPYLYGGSPFPLTLCSGLTVLLGPNGAGKTHVLRAIKLALQTRLQQLGSPTSRRTIIRLLTAGRSAPFEMFRGSLNQPGSLPREPAAVGHSSHIPVRHGYESLTGDMLALNERADIRVKVEARLQALFRRRLRLRWSQAGLEIAFVSGDGEYGAKTEASGVLQLIGLLAALYDDAVDAVLIDEPEISLHPQLQAFLLEEVRQTAGDPLCQPGKKIVILSTHAQGMLPLRRIGDLPNLVFFRDTNTPPRQVPYDSDVLQRRNLIALITRLGESHRTAFFASTVLLVEGPSDEIVLGALAARLDLSLGGAGVQIVPVIGKGEILETARLFRLMGKRVVVLADLDAIADNKSLLNAFAEEPEAEVAAARAGHASLLKMDGQIRTDFAQVVTDNWADLEPLATQRHYQSAAEGKGNVEKAKRRAALAAVLSSDEGKLRALTHGQDLVGLRDRFYALLGALEAAGCFLLRRGTIEDYYQAPVAQGSAGKPEAAANEAATFPEVEEANLTDRYKDVLRAIRCAAPAPPVDEGAFLREQLAGLLATLFQSLKPDTRQEDIDAAARASNSDAALIFRVENASSDYSGIPSLRVNIISPLFARSGSPAVIRRDQSLHDEVARLLS